MKLFHSRSKVALAVVALAVLAVTAPLKAEDNIPFEAELTVVFAESVRNVRVFDVEGVATLMGPVIGEVRDHDRGPRGVGTLLLQGSNGDMLFLSYEIAEGEPGQFGGVYTVEGGTGRFEGATGGGVIIGQDLAVGVFDVTLEGILSFFNFGDEAGEALTQTASTTYIGLSALTAGTRLHVADIEIWFNSGGIGRGQRLESGAVVSVVDEYGNPVSGVAVTGDFSGAYTLTGASGTTDASGAVLIAGKSFTCNTTKQTVLTFRVTSVSKNGMTYDPSANVETSDSRSCAY